MLEGTDRSEELNKHDHMGRRHKLRTRFMTHGLDAFTESEVLEFALSFCIPRCDTNPTAHKLLNAFGSLDAVVNAKPDDLAEIPGIGEQTAVFLHFLKSATIYLNHYNTSRGKIIAPDDAAQHLATLLQSYSDEQFLVTCLDDAGNIIKLHNITNHDPNRVGLNIREIITVVTDSKTTQVIVAHNHLNDNPLPSAADMQLTRHLSFTFTSLDIKLLDHIIFSPRAYYSFHRSELLEGLLRDAKVKLEDYIDDHNPTYINKDRQMDK